MPNLTIDDTEITVEAGLTVIQACEIAGATIPRFCYHETLSVAGNCRMCLVEVEMNGRPMPKLQASCALPVAEGMLVRTTSEKVKKGRQGIMEFLLINHPLDCPICDQGGECDLQDQALVFGRGTTRYEDPKRAVDDKPMGPLIKTIMTRCIHCTRCVRFSSEVAGVTDMGMINRGENAEITTLGKTVGSELSGNVIDLCPVGALTAKPIAFQARSWETHDVPSLDLFDALGSHIVFAVRGESIMRVLPRYAPEINGEWIGDKTRFAFDGLRERRIDRPYMRDQNNTLQAQDQWAPAIAAAAQLIAARAASTAILLGATLPAEAAFLATAMARTAGVAIIDTRIDGGASAEHGAEDAMFGTPIDNFSELDAVITIGANLKTTVPTLNARLREAWLNHDLLAVHVGEAVESTYPIEQIGTTPAELKKLAEGTHPLAAQLGSCTNGAVVLDLTATADNPELIAVAQHMATTYGFAYCGFTTAASRVGNLLVGAHPGADAPDLEALIADKHIDTLWLLGVDDLPTAWLEQTTVIYHGTHGDVVAGHADVILPTAAWGEQQGVYVSCEGRVQHALAAVTPPGMAREDWKVLRALAGELGRLGAIDKSYAKPSTLPTRADLLDALYAAHPELDNSILPNSPLHAKESTGEVETTPRKFAWKDIGAVTGGSASGAHAYHQSCALSRASATMAACVTAAGEAA